MKKQNGAAGLRGGRQTRGAGSGWRPRLRENDEWKSGGVRLKGKGEKGSGGCKVKMGKFTSFGRFNRQN